MAESIGLREPLLYARVRGSAAATRERQGKRVNEDLDEEIGGIDARVRALVSPEEFEAAVERGRDEEIVDLFMEMTRVAPSEHDE
jgi:hypothetical protein